MRLNKQSLSFLALLLVFNFSWSSNYSLPDTIYVAGNISSNTTWWGSQTVIVTGDLTVDNEVKLTINAGTKVVFAGSHYLKVNGCINAEGTKENNIYFTKDDTTGFSGADTVGGWRGIRFFNTSEANDSSIFKYCIVEFGKVFQATSNWDNMGGGFFISGYKKVRIENCEIRNNKASFYGGGIRIHSSKIRIINTKIINNNSSLHGGGIYIYGVNNNLLTGCLIAGNYSGGSGGGIYINGANPSITNCTMADNIAKDYGNSIVVTGDVNLMYFTNCIIAEESNNVNLVATNTDPNFSHCDIRGGKASFSGAGAGDEYNGVYENNIETDPLFDSDSEEPYNIKDTSPLIGMGTNISDLPAYDIIGNSRIVGDSVDIGCYETSVVTKLNTKNIAVNTYKLEQNYPNPFNPLTNISFTLPNETQVKVTVYNLLGQTVAILFDGHKPAGSYSLTFEASNFSSGIYFYEIKCNKFHEIKKMLLTK
jgi:hypothetical protein